MRQTRHVLYLAIVKGMRNKEIAELIGISPSTVKEHLWQSVLKGKLKSRRQGYAYYAIRFHQEMTSEK